METMPGETEWLLTWRPVADGAEILRAATADRIGVLPPAIAELPVVALGNHALAPDRPAVEGNRLRITCGASALERPDNRGLERLTLPPTLRRVGDYAFYNCTGLKELRLSEPVDAWGGSVFMNCRVLDTFYLRAADDRAVTAAYLADELVRELDLTIEYPGGEPARLIFPGYQEFYEENAPAHHFDYTIGGAGYPYHHVFKARALPLPEFDALFPGMLTKDHDPLTALRLAWNRLRFPRELEAAARTQYRTYLQSRAGDVLAWLLAARDSRGLSWFLPWCGADREVLGGAAETARRRGCAEMLALILERQHRESDGGGLDKRFDL